MGQSRNSSEFLLNFAGGKGGISVEGSQFQRTYCRETGHVAGPQIHSTIMPIVTMLSQGFMAAASMKRAGNVSDIEALAIVSAPSSGG